MEDNDGPYNVAPVECPLCTHRWVGIWPVGMDEIDCPHCENMVEPIILEQ